MSNVTKVSDAARAHANVKAATMAALLNEAMLSVPTFLRIRADFPLHRHFRGARVMLLVCCAHARRTGESHAEPEQPVGGSASFCIRALNACESSKNK